MLTVRADPVMRYAQATADALHDPARYIEAVMSAKPVPSRAAVIGRGG
jgi:multicomponent K+:H+ antiporter subunit D